MIVIAVVLHIHARSAPIFSFFSFLFPSIHYHLRIITVSSPHQHHTTTITTTTTTMSTEWSLDFCLACDRQTSGGPYCSQTCRLAELDRPADQDASSPRRGGASHSRSSTLESNLDTRSARSLSASSSQTSLSSLKSQASDTTISDQLQDELRDYASSFDPVRDLKRRMTTS